ncbi:MAG: hypothetical protein ABEH35_04330 [Haloarculaceae archaeon]
MGDSLSRETAERLVEHVRRYTDESLRGAVYYLERDRELLYIREDIREMYSPEEIDAVVDDLVLEALGDIERLEHRYHMGPLECTARWFEDGIVFHFPYDERSGVALSVDHAVASQMGMLTSTGVSLLDEHRSGGAAASDGDDQSSE